MARQQIKLQISKDEWQGQTVHFRKNYIIIKVVAQDQEERTAVKVLQQILDGIVNSYDVETQIGLWFYVRVPDGTDIIALADSLAPRPDVAYAEPSLILQGVSPRPNDKYLDKGYTSGPDPLWQWAIDHLDMPAAWDFETGNDSVVIGLLDSGVPLNPGSETALSLGSAMDGHMNHDDFDGTRFITGKNYLLSPASAFPDDTHGHGTNMAGILAATEDNVIGVAGMNWQSVVYVCRVLDDDLKADAGNVYAAVEEVLNYANADPLKPKNAVINMSFTFLDVITGLDYGTLETQSASLVAHGGIMVCGAGNEDEIIRFPAAAAAFRPNNIVAVGATKYADIEAGDEPDHIWGLSNYGGRVAFDNGDEVDFDITVVAPGQNLAVTGITENEDGTFSQTYDVESGTSEATAHVTGLVSLMWSRNPNMTAAQIVHCLKKTSAIPDHILEGWTDLDPPQKWYGHGLINPVEALDAVDWEVILETADIRFEDVPPGEELSAPIVLRVKCCAAITFTVAVAGDDFGILAGTYVHDPESGTFFDQIVATYSTDLPNVASATVTIAWDQMTDLDPFTVQITANRVGAVQKIILLAADKSGSMNNDSGIGEYSRMRVLKYSTGVLVDLVDEGDSMGIAAFDKTAHHVADITMIDPQDPDTSRDALKTSVDSVDAGGRTSIGAGLERARDMLDDAPAGAGEQRKAIIVLTDGKENEEPYIASLLEQEFPYPVYAIGMGIAETLEPEALIAFSGTTGGHMIITGALDNESENDVAAFYDKILAEICGDSLVLDPTQRLRPGSQQEFQIKVTGADSQIDVALFHLSQAPLEVKLETPTGEEAGGVSVLHGTRVTRYRLPLPADCDSGAAHAGVWRAKVSIEEGAFEAFLTDVDAAASAIEAMGLHGVRYSLQARVKSNLRMRTRLYQTSFEPGAIMTLRAVVTQNGLPLHDPTKTVEALSSLPDGGEEVLPFEVRSPGVYETGIHAMVPGVYKFRIVAQGRSGTGDRYRREQFVTGMIRRPGLTGDGIAPRPRP